jgi:thiol-disulfide isomerase/thioredoxin
MKLIGLFITSLVLLSINMHADTVYVHGQWANGPEVVSMTYTEDAAVPKYRFLKASIDPVNHRFTIKAEVSRPTMLQFHNQFFIVLPGDTVNVEVTGNESDAELIFNGRYRMEHNFLIRLRQAMGTFPASKFKIDQQSIGEYKIAATHHYDSSLLFLIDDVKRFQMRKSFAMIAQGYLTILYYSNLLYPVIGGFVSKEKLPQYYFELVDFSFFKKPDFLGFRDFVVAASFYNAYYYTNAPVKSYYDSASVAARIKSANYNFFGEVKDNLLLSIFSLLAKNGSDVNGAQIQTLYEYLTGVFKEDPKRVQQLQEARHEFDIVNKPFPLKVLEQQLKTPKGKTISLAEVLATDEVVYIDFWASWCGPCIGEMPSQKQLMSELEGQKVKFIFISFDDDEKKWQKALSKIKVDGEHYLISEGFASAIARYISFNEIPRYLILDKEGRLVTRQAPRPSAILQDKSKLVSLLE